jgi:MFS family permease
MVTAERHAPARCAAMLLDPGVVHEAPRVFRWNDRAVLGPVLASFASGVAQFGVVAALGSVARNFGHLSHGATIADQAGLSGTTLAAGLAVIRLASLGGLPLAGMADRVGRRRALLVTLCVGLALTATSSASPGYWWFVVIFACGRPLLSATNALSEVIAAEQTDSTGRARALALVAAGYGVGAGLTAIVHSLASGVLGSRGLFLLAAAPLALVPVIRRWTRESDHFAIAHASREHPPLVLGPVEARFRSRLLILMAIAFALSFITGPANSLIFLDAQNVAHLSGAVTAAMVAGAGVTGLVGLLAGRWMSDRWGRRLTGAVGMVGLGLAGVLAYSGPKPALVVGYVCGVMFGSVFAPAGGALVNELFPTTVRASASGWFVAAGVLGAVGGLLTFGAVADVGNRFGFAADVTFLPAVALAALFWLLPETMGVELDDV